MTEPKAKTVLLFGATGTIGSAVERELRQQGHSVTCVVRSGKKVSNLRVEYVNRLDRNSIRGLFLGKQYDAVISCIASRSGTREDAWAVDYVGNSFIIEAAKLAGVKHAILLSAICVQKPTLPFHMAKLSAESEFSGSGLIWTIIRPTAFFKSLSGQIERVRKGKRFLLFGDGELTRCKPISDGDLARFIVRALDDAGMHNKVLPIGGPGPAITPKEQGAILFEVLGKEPKFRHVPVKWLDRIIAALDLAGKISKRARAKADYARIGRYYATESMLVWDAEAKRYDADATPEFGSETLRNHYEGALRK